LINRLVLTFAAVLINRLGLTFAAVLINQSPWIDFCSGLDLNALVGTGVALAACTVLGAMPRRRPAIPVITLDVSSVLCVLDSGQ